jgi:uncharacterized protein
MRCVFAAIFAALILAPVAAGAGEYTPLDCAKAKSATEKTICKDYGLGQLEGRMATLYAVATSLVAMGQRGNMLGAQRDFRQERENCGANVGCIRQKYDARIAALQGSIDTIASRGPY